MFQNEPERGAAFDFERLIVYQKAMELSRLTTRPASPRMAGLW